MLKINNYRTLFIALLLLDITACTTPFTKVNDASIATESEPTKQASSVWQDAYGEAQQHDINTLSAQLESEPEALEQAEAIDSTDLWQRIRKGYGIPYPQLHAETKKQLKWFADHPEYINRVVERAKPYLHYIVEELEQRNMPLEIALLPVVESAFQPYAYSTGRAAGLWQFIPGTGLAYGLEQNWWYDGRRDVIESTEAAITYLDKLHNDFGDWPLALAAYNCGGGTVRKAIRKNIEAGKDIDFWSLSLPRETTAYVPKLLAIAHLIKHPEQYQLTLNPVDNTPFFTVVDIGSQIDLSLAAQLAEMSKDELYQLNPGFNQWATRPNGPHRLVIPLDKQAAFQQALDALPASERVQWTRHKIKSGESLGGIAHHYKTTVTVLREANGIKGSNIRAGRHLLIPIDATAVVKNHSASVDQNLIATQSGNKKIHTVKAGDTWWDLANSYNVNVKQLTSWNGKTPQDGLSIGQKLEIWAQAKSKSQDKSLRTINYKIRSGDSLWKISRKFKVSVAEVREWNGLSDRTLLKPGQNITLYVDVTQQHGAI
ncbi:MAG: lytic transglycosylase [Gammaproteobacteria bacterium]|nr:MAG: lytic transglycosylase [Gammaproteobacteria bacterium]